MAKIKIKRDRAAQSSTYNKIQVKSPVNKSRMTSDDGGRKFSDVASGFIPGYETYLDVKDIAKGTITGNKEMRNRGILGLAAPVSGKAVMSGLDYAAEKMLGKKEADRLQEKRESVTNMKEEDLAKLFKKYGRGGYDKWVAEGKPKL
jgi:hypothetical protein